MIKLIKPRYFCVGDYPESMEICRTELGENDKELLCFLFEHLFIMSLIQGKVDVIVTIGIYCVTFFYYGLSLF